MACVISHNKSTSRRSSFQTWKDKSNKIMRFSHDIVSQTEKITLLKPSSEELQSTTGSLISISNYKLHCLLLRK